MKVRLSCICVNLIFVLCFVQQVHAQFLVDMIDTTVTEDKGLWAIYRNTDHLQISGYFQPQFQVAQSKGEANYSGGDFPENSNNRFMLRRARIRFDYAHFSDKGEPQAQVVFQFDGSERGVMIRDFWGRVYENKLKLFSFTTGMFARPFGYEVNLSSGDRETPERGRMSQILMRTERDLGAMVTFEPRRGSKFRLVKLDLGVFNGQGLTATEEFDSFKDLIARLSLKPYNISKKVSLSAGTSFFQGGLVQNTAYRYQLQNVNGIKTFTVDSSLNNFGSKAPRRYRGFDAQVKVKNSWGKTEFRAEYWWGLQSGFASESNTPSVPLNQPFYIRKFNGAFLYLVQDIGNGENQAIVKYDIYDPNREIEGTDIGKAGLNLTEGDIKYYTLGFGYLHHFTTHLKFLAWYDMIMNEKTSMEGYENDVKDNVLTLRIQYRF